MLPNRFLAQILRQHSSGLPRMWIATHSLPPSFRSPLPEDYGWHCPGHPRPLGNIQPSLETTPKLTYRRLIRYSPVQKTGRGGQPAFSGSGFNLSNALARGSLETILSPWELAPKVKEAWYYSFYSQPDVAYEISGLISERITSLQEGRPGIKQFTQKEYRPGLGAYKWQK